MLLGNKSDLNEEREVYENEGLEFAKSHGYIFYEISCKENINVFPAFEKLIEITYKVLDDADKNYIILNKKKVKKKKCCY